MTFVFHFFFPFFLYSHNVEDGVFQLDGVKTLPPSCDRRVHVQTEQKEEEMHFIMGV